MNIKDFNKEQLEYCSNICDIGCNTKKRLLDESESASDAAFDMHCFVEKCSETCDIIKRVGIHED